MESISDDEVAREVRRATRGYGVSTGYDLLYMCEGSRLELKWQRQRRVKRMRRRCLALKC